MRRYAQELIGTFFLVLTIGSTGIAAGPGVIAPLAIGAVLMVMIYTGGHISGAHYNPAVTLGVYIRGRCPIADVIPYMAAQVFGAVVAASLVMLFKAGAPATPFMARSTAMALAGEFLFTFMGLVSPMMLWIYLTADFLGGATAAIVFKVLNTDDK